MDKLKNILFKIAFILLFIAVTFFSGYLVKSCEKKPQPSIISDTIVNIDTLRYKDTVFYPKPVEVIKPIFDSIIDTVYVINDYYTGKIYEYNFKDTNLTFKAGIMLHKNSLVYLIPEYEIYRKTTTINNNVEVVKPPKFMLSVGGGIDYFNMVGVNIAASVYFDKNDIGIIYDPFLKGFGITYKRVLIYK